MSLYVAYICSKFACNIFNRYEWFFISFSLSSFEVSKNCHFWCVDLLSYHRLTSSTCEEIEISSILLRLPSDFLLHLCISNKTRRIPKKETEGKKKKKTEMTKQKRRKKKRYSKLIVLRFFFIHMNSFDWKYTSNHDYYLVHLFGFIRIIKQKAAINRKNY